MSWLREVPRVYARRLEKVWSPDIIECWFPVAVKPGSYALIAQANMPVADCNWCPGEDSHLLLVNIRAGIMNLLDFPEYEVRLQARPIKSEGFNPDEIIPNLNTKPIVEMTISELSPPKGGYQLVLDGECFALNKYSDKQLDILLQKLLNNGECGVLWDYGVDNLAAHCIPDLEVLSSPTLLWG